MNIVLRRATTQDCLDDQDDWTGNAGAARHFSDGWAAVRHGLDNQLFDTEVVYEFDEARWSFKMPVAVVPNGE